jgi:hypothetical protein
VRQFTIQVGAVIMISSVQGGIFAKWIKSTEFVKRGRKVSLKIPSAGFLVVVVLAVIYFNLCFFSLHHKN